MIHPYQTIHSFFDSYGLVHARSILTGIVKKADSRKSWNRSAPCDVLFFAERMSELIEAAYHISYTFTQHPEVILNKETEDDIWLLTDYDNYCGCHRNNTPWDFFPRYLTQKEFLDPYRALKKFTRFKNIDQWKEVIRDLAYHALSDISLDEFNHSENTLRIYIHLHKLIEAAHLIDIRVQPETPESSRKWKDRKLTC